MHPLYPLWVGLSLIREIRKQFYSSAPISMDLNGQRRNRTCNDVSRRAARKRPSKINPINNPWFHGNGARTKSIRSLPVERQKKRSTDFILQMPGNREMGGKPPIPQFFKIRYNQEQVNNKATPGIPVASVNLPLTTLVIHRVFTRHLKIFGTINAYTKAVIQAITCAIFTKAFK